MIAKMVEKELTARTEITFPQLIMMVMIKHKTGGKQSEMAKMGHLTEAAVSRMVEGMVEKVLVTRKENPDSRREHMLEITEKGKKEMDKGMEIVKETMKKIFGVLSSREQEMLENILDKILGFVYTGKDTKNYA